MAEIFIPRIFCPVLMMIWRPWLQAKIYYSKYFCNVRVAGIGKISVQQKFSAIRYLLALLQIAKYNIFWASSLTKRKYGPAD